LVEKETAVDDFNGCFVYLGFRIEDLALRIEDLIVNSEFKQAFTIHNSQFTASPNSSSTHQLITHHSSLIRSLSSSVQLLPVSANCSPALVFAFVAGYFYIVETIIKK